MSEDRVNENVVLGSKDKTSMLQDVACELDVLMAEHGYTDIWEAISDQA